MLFQQVIAIGFFKWHLFHIPIDLVGTYVDFKLVQLALAGHILLCLLIMPCTEPTNYCMVNNADLIRLISFA